VFGFGAAGLGYVPLSGDYNGDGVDTVGLYRPVTGQFVLKNTNGPGAADLVLGYGPVNAKPLIGNWDGQ
jgi:hypothetical protein